MRIGKLDEYEAMFYSSVQALLNLEEAIKSAVKSVEEKSDLGVGSDACGLNRMAQEDPADNYSDINAEDKSKEGNISNAQRDITEEKTIDDSPKPKTKCDYIVNELITSEEEYIHNLEYTFSNYEEWLIDAIGGYDQKRIFKNLKEIISASKDFLHDLKTNQNTGDANDIGAQFIKNESLFKKYITYCKNKRTADSTYMKHRSIIKEREIALGDKLGLHTGLLRPVQRLAKYELLLAELQKNQDLEKPRLVEASELILNVSVKSNIIIALEELFEPKRYNATLRRNNSHNN